jgi:hypothetical protein
MTKAVVLVEEIEPRNLLLRGQKIIIDAGDIVCNVQCSVFRRNVTEHGKLNTEHYARFCLPTYSGRESRGGRKLRPPGEPEILTTIFQCSVFSVQLPSC